VFDRAISAAPWTLPSHASLFTGRAASALSTSWETGLDTRKPTLAELFAKRGYRTGGFVGNLLYTIRESGLQRGFSHYEDFTLTWRDILWSATLMQTRPMRELVRQRNPRGALRALATLDLQLPREPEQGRKWAPSILDDFLRWEVRDGGRPYFAFINLFDAHEPFPPPEPWASRFSQTPRVRDWYDGGIAFMDHELGRLFAELRRRGSLDNTLVIITADHGEQFGENGWTGHGNSLYIPSLHVPLVMRWPGKVPAGRRVASLTSLRDLGATIVAMTGGTERFPGEVLTTVHSDSAHVERAALSEVEPGPWKNMPRKIIAQRSIVSGDFHYLRNIDGTEELYHLRADPTEQKNLVGDAAMRDTLEAKRSQLAESMRRR
jgi:arylsulfatase A-like enzyme